MIKIPHVNVIGAGFAGIECALYLAKRGVRVHVFNAPRKDYSCDACSLVSANQENSRLKEALKKEVKNLGSELIDEEIRLDNISRDRCNAQKVLEYGIKKLKNNPNIDYFELCVHEINPKEVNIIASGHKTDGKLLNFFQDKFGSQKVFNCYSVYPCITGDDLESKLYKVNDKYYLPFSYDEYIALCNMVIKERNENLEKYNPSEHKNCCIEDIVIKDKDALRNFCMKEVLLPCQRPYAVLHLDKVNDGFEIHGFCSSLPIQAQENIIRSIKGFENVILLSSGKPIANSYLNAPLVMNAFGQAIKQENLFFAGNISGIIGHVEGMASGLYIAKNVFDYLNGKILSTFDSNSVFGRLYSKLFEQNAIKFKPIMANCDILK